MHHDFVAESVGRPLPFALAARLGETRAAEKGEAGRVVRTYVAPQLVQAEDRAGIAAYDIQRIRRKAFAAVCRIVDQDADARTAVLRIELEQIERSDGGQAGGLFHGAAGEGP